MLVSVVDFDGYVVVCFCFLCSGCLYKWCLWEDGWELEVDLLVCFVSIDIEVIIEVVCVGVGIVQVFICEWVVVDFVVGCLVEVLFGSCLLLLLMWLYYLNCCYVLVKLCVFIELLCEWWQLV